MTKQVRGDPHSCVPDNILRERHFCFLLRFLFRILRETTKSATALPLSSHSPRYYTEQHYGGSNCDLPPPPPLDPRQENEEKSLLPRGGGEGRVHLIREGRNLLLPAIACRRPRFLFLIPTSISLALERDGDTNAAFGGRWIPTLDLMLILQFSLPSLRQPKAGRGRRRGRRGEVAIRTSSSSSSPAPDSRDSRHGLTLSCYYFGPYALGAPMYQTRSLIPYMPSD